jgi:hypothetical protein
MTFERALSELRFDDAAELIGGASAAVQPDLNKRLDDERTRRQPEAQELYRRIVDLSTIRDHASLLDLKSDPDTDRLVGLLSETARDRVALAFRYVDRWLESQVATSRRRLADARRASHGLDLQLARGLLARVDGRFLDESERQERDDLLLEIAARMMELEDLESTGSRLIEEATPQRRRWWRRN